eukprot:TRINITY_DN39606_c0_g1_i2.p1 TRINITY_DN39606_c0_g1~~TRINITY_DN39606_c0_g1_i2.p1  ORF type:complete len:574 (-),score=44.29 TRINITY_DN39606_c0_g1_i2:214-1935(-)
MSRKTIVGQRAMWFRASDLRLDDNTALTASLRDAKSLLPVYVFDPACFNTVTRYGGARKSSARRAKFLVECVVSLRRRLESYGSGLAVGLGSPAEVMSKFCAGCESIFVTEGFCSEERREEAQVARALNGSELKRVWGGTLFFPNELGNDPDNITLGHMQFRSNCRTKGRIRDPIPEPYRFAPLPQGVQGDASAEISRALKFMPSLQELGYSAQEVDAANVDDPRAALVWEGGEEAAWARLQKWMFDDDHLKDYRDIQNGMVGEGYSSKLSPWLARGCISPRRIRQEALRYEAERKIKNFSTYWLPNMLEWRDFMIYIARSQGDRIFKLGGITGDRSPWHGTLKDLQAWKDGRTGEAIVDAAMKELLLTGYMSMRARHIVATYLIYDLGVDWRLGAAHFEEHLLDYDPALNWVMWMQAPGLLGRGGRHQGLLHFSVKKSVGSQRKQLNNPVDREFIQHWRGDSHLDVATKSSSRQSARREQRAPVPSNSSAAGYPQTIGKVGDQDIDVKLRTRMERFSEHMLVQPEVAEEISQGDGFQGKGNVRHRGSEDSVQQAADEDVAERPRKGRWRKSQ